MSGYVWVPPGGGAFDDDASWIVGTIYPAPNPPGPGDTAGIVSITGAISGDGNVGSLAFGFSTLTVSGTITATHLGFATSTITVSGGILTGSTTFTINADASVSVNNHGSIVGPSDSMDELIDFGTLDINQGTAQAYQVQVNGTASLQSGTIDTTITGVGGTSTSATLDVGDGGVVQDGTGFVGSVVGGTAAASLHGAGAKWTNSQSFSIGPNAGGSLTMQGGASLDAQGGGEISGIPALADDGNLSVQDAGSQISVTGDAGIGIMSGSGTLSLNNSASLDVTGTLDAGYSAGSGTIAISGGNAGADYAVIGDAGTGVLTVAADGELDTLANTDIGAQAGSNGSATLNAGGSLTVGGTLTVGDAGAGTLLDSGGALTESGFTVTLGAQSTGNGKLTVQGGTVDFVADLKVGDAGTGTVLVQNTSELSANNLTVANQSAANGSFTVDGEGSSGQLSGAIVGSAGKGSMKVSNSARLTISGNLQVGAEVAPGASSSVLVDTQGVLQVGETLTVGEAAKASMTVQNLAVASAPTIVVGDSMSGIGTLTVTGTVASGGGSAETQLFYGDMLTVGVHGTASLVVSHGAAVGPQVTGQGTIEIAVQNDGTGSVSLTDAGSSLTAALLTVGGTGAAAEGSGTLSIGAGPVVSAGTFVVWSTGSLVLAGASVGDSMTMGGTMSGYGDVTGAMINAGTIIAVGGTLTLGTVTGLGGKMTVGSKTTKGTLELTVGAPVSQSIAFKSGVLLLDDIADTLAPISNFTTGDTIEVKSIAADGASFASGVLTLTSGTSSLGTLPIRGSYTSSDFNVVAQGTTATEITYIGPPPCYAAGTRIATVRGAVAVEHLRGGDRVISAFGGSAPVVWLGRRRVHCRRHRKPEAVWPVRVRAGAIAAGLPTHDLVLSPDHALYLDDVLIPVRYLVNGSTVVQESVDAVTYFHLELPSHDVIFAEGLPAESYLDTGNRGAFENGGGAVQMHPDFALRVWLAEACGDQVTHGPKLEAVRRRLRGRAAMLRHAAGGRAAAASARAG